MRDIVFLEQMWRLPFPRPTPARPQRRSLAAERRRLMLERRCFVCRRTLESGEVCIVGFLGILIHIGLGPCMDTLYSVGKDYSRSARGRWRPKSEVLRALAERWP